MNYTCGCLNTIPQEQKLCKQNFSGRFAAVRKKKKKF